MIPADPTPAYAAMTWTSISGIVVASAGVLAIGLAVLKTGRSPLTLLVRAALRLQGEWMWLIDYAWPAVRRERHQIEWCLRGAHRRVVETAPPAQTREPVAIEKHQPPPGSAQLTEIRDTMRDLVRGLSA